MNTTIQVVEAFLSLQGEGPSAGEPALFLRLANCNLNCVWCDTRHSWDWSIFNKSEEVEDVPLEELQARILCQLSDEVGLIVLTGGEPLLHQQTIVPLLIGIRKERPAVRVEVETNGTIIPTQELRELVHLFVVSPKLTNSGVTKKRRIRPSALAEFSKLHSILKFVLESSVELHEACSVADRSGFSRDRVWVMPQTTSAAELGTRIADLAPGAIKAGFKISSRLHILAWGDTRGT